jgi:hypothetical protein
MARASQRRSGRGKFRFLFEMRGARVAKVSFYIRRDDALGAAGLRE